MEVLPLRRRSPQPEHVTERAERRLEPGLPPPLLAASLHSLQPDSWMAALVINCYQEHCSDLTWQISLWMAWPFKFFFFNWSIVDLHCVSFRCTTNWFNFIHTHTHTHTHTHIYIFFSDSTLYKILWNIKWSSLCYIAGPISILYIIMYILIPNS